MNIEKNIIEYLENGKVVKSEDWKKEWKDMKINISRIRVQLDAWSLYYREYIVGFIVGLIIGLLI